MTRRGFFAALLALPLAARAALSAPIPGLTIGGVPLYGFGCLSPRTLVGVDDRFVAYLTANWKLQVASPNCCARIQNIGL
jgi:hypothetical protein